MTREHSLKTVNFVFIGSKLPSYALSSIRLAQIYSGMGVNLIANSQIESAVRTLDINFTSIEDFYTPAAFSHVEPKLLHSSSFRDGFWSKTIERFFVIDQYLKHSGDNQFFHAELDQLLFRTDELVNAIERTKLRGAFFPFHSYSHACASIFYCNDPLSIQSFVNFTLDSSVATSDMQLLADWAHSDSQKVFALPTIANEFEKIGLAKTFDSIAIQSSELNGIVDAAQLGQWVGGEDPRNVPIGRKPRNRFNGNNSIGSLAEGDLNELSFFLDENQTLKIHMKNGPRVNLYNLHLHSKIHPWILKSDAKFSKILLAVNEVQTVTLPTTRKIQVMYSINVALQSFRRNPIAVIKRRSRKIGRLIHW